MGLVGGPSIRGAIDDAGGGSNIDSSDSSAITAPLGPNSIKVNSRGSGTDSSLIFRRCDVLRDSTNDDREGNSVSSGRSGSINGPIEALFVAWHAAGVVVIAVASQVRIRDGSGISPSQPRGSASKLASERCSGIQNRIGNGTAGAGNRSCSRLTVYVVDLIVGPFPVSATLVEYSIGVRGGGRVVGELSGKANVVLNLAGRIVVERIG